VPPTNSPQCSYLPTVQGQIAISQSKKAKEKGLKKRISWRRRTTNIHTELFLRISYGK